MTDHGVELGENVVAFDEPAHGYDARALATIDAREIAREEIASLAGMFLRRLQDVEDEEHLSAADMRSLWGEALADFSSESSPGPQPAA